MKTDNVLIRLATSRDTNDVSSIYLASRKKFLDFASLVHSDEDIRQWIASIIAKGHITVAERNKQTLGMIALSKTENMGCIDQLYVLPSAMNQGIGSLLIEFAKASLGSPIQLYTFQQNIIAQRFYEQHGFEAILFRDGSKNEENCPDILFKWSKKKQ